MLGKWKIEATKDLYEQVSYCALNVNVLESMKDWVRVIDKNGNILFINKSMSDYTNVNSLEYKCSFEEDVIGEDSVIPKSVSLTTLLTGRTITNEILFLGKEYSVRSSPIFNDDDEVFAAVEVFRNISEEVTVRRELYNANKKMVDDINFAKTIQKQLLPKKHDYANVKVDYFYKPSESLSGDMFGVVEIDSDRTGFYICDVVGHGVSASLLTMFIKQNLSSLINGGYGLYPNLLLNKMKEKFSELKLSPSVYATIFYGFYSKSTGEFVYANAGHNCIPLHLTDGEVNPLKAKGFPISDLFTGFVYEEHVTDLEAGDKIVFYTDGFTEAKNYKGEEFGLDRFLKIIKKDENIIENVVGAVEDFVWGNPDDDMALLLIEVD